MYAIFFIYLSHKCISEEFTEKNNEHREISSLIKIVNDMFMDVIVSEACMIPSKGTF